MQVDSTQQSAVEFVEVPSAVNAVASVKAEFNAKSKVRVEPEAKPERHRQIQMPLQQQLKTRGGFKVWGR